MPRRRRKVKLENQTRKTTDTMKASPSTNTVDAGGGEANGDDVEQTGASANRNFNLMIPLPIKGDKFGNLIEVRQVVNRLSSTGYTDIGFCHTVYGKPDSQEDTADATMALISQEQQKIKSKKVGLKETRNHQDLRLWKRLHAVLENQSDVGFYTRRSTSAAATTTTTTAVTTHDHQLVLQGYDIVSVCPRNEATFRAVCLTASGADILTLDYTSEGRPSLPFRIRSADVKAAAERNLVFELLYSPAILQTNYRRALVQTARSLQMASLGASASNKKVSIILSAGSSNVMTLRSPGDLINVMTTVLLFNPVLSQSALGQAAQTVCENAMRRRLGNKPDPAVKVLGEGYSKSPATSEDANRSEKEQEENKNKKRKLDEDDDLDDGFIKF